MAVFWNSHVNATLRANIGQFYADLPQSAYWEWLPEYDTVGLAGGSSQAILPGASGGSVVIAPANCAGSGACTLTDAQLQTELARQIDLGVLPSPTVDCTGNANTVYMVDFPPNVTLVGPPGVGTSCSAFCAYHNTGTVGPRGVPLVYAALMDVFTGPCAGGCAGNATAMEDATTVASHELVEAVTDPDIGLDTLGVYAPPAAWGDNESACGEIADICATGGPGDAITVNGRTWVVQELWSNAQGRCTSTGPVLAVCSGDTLTGCRKCSCGDNGRACSGGAPVCETASGNVADGACEQCTAASGTCGPSRACDQSATLSEDDRCAAVVPAAEGKAPWLTALVLLWIGGFTARGRRSWTEPANPPKYRLLYSAGEGNRTPDLARMKRPL